VRAVIRTGAVADLFPSTFPSGQGSDLAGVVEEVGSGVAGFSPGDEVIGFSNNRASQAELVLVEAGDLTRKPEKVSWEEAGGLYVAGVTAWGAVQAVQAKEGETVVISGAAIALGVATDRIDTIADFAAAAKYGVKTDGGREAGPGAIVLGELAGLIADGQLEVTVAKVYPLAQVREAYTELERRHTHGKIVLRP
jgi:NADPH:quinone reductase-like Zn-dependent oxidoreductase